MVVRGCIFGGCLGRTHGFSRFGDIEITGERVFGNGLGHDGGLLRLLVVIHADGLSLVLRTLGFGVHVHGDYRRIIEDVCDVQDDGVNYEWTHCHFAFLDETS